MGGTISSPLRLHGTTFVSDEVSNARARSSRSPDEVSNARARSSRSPRDRAITCARHRDCPAPLTRRERRTGSISLQALVRGIRRFQVTRNENARRFMGTGTGVSRFLHTKSHGEGSMRGYPLTAAILAASFCVLPVRVPSAEDIHQPKGAPPASADANYNEDAWQTILPYQKVLGVLGKAKPLALLGPHSAPLGMRFYTGSMFPSEYRSAIFIARHGSWNRSKKVGGDIVVAKLNKDGTVKSIEPFLTGFIENNNYRSEERRV